MRAAAHHMVRFMTAGMALITCREPLLISISNNLRSNFLAALRVSAATLTCIMEACPFLPDRKRARSEVTERVFLVLGFLFRALLSPVVSYKCIAWMLFLRCFEWPVVCQIINTLFFSHSDCRGFVINCFGSHFAAIYSKLKAMHPQQNSRQTC